MKNFIFYQVPHFSNGFFNFSPDLNVKNKYRLLLIFFVLAIFHVNKIQAFSSEILIQELITGKVTDPEGFPLPGVTVSVKDTNTGVYTDMEGNFSLRVETGSEILVFSFMGMSTIELKLEETNNYNVQMEADMEALEEVVMIGYGKTRRADLTGATSSISAKDLSENRAVLGVSDALQGKLAGVRITRDAGGPGTGSTIMIRGATSLSGDNQPLFVVDGFPVDNFDLNADDIETIDVLKDISSTAIYGSRGANGVIIVTTKKGKKAGSNIEVSAKYGISELSSKIDMIDNVQWVKQIYEQSVGYTPLREWNGVMAAHVDYYQDIEGNIWSLSKFDADGNPHPFKNHEIFRDSTNTDWQEEVFRTAILKDYRVNFTNASDKSSYNLSLNMIDNEGIIPNNKQERILGRFNMSNQLTEKLEIVSNTYYTKTKNSGYSNIVRDLLNRSPRQPLSGPWDSSNIPGYNEEGRLTNPFDQTQFIDRDVNSAIFQSNLTFNYEITDKLVLNVGGSWRENEIKQEFYTPKNSPGPGLNFNGVAEFGSFNFQDIVNNNYLTYSENFNNHNLSFMLGNSLEWSRSNNFSVENRNFELETLRFYGIGGGTEPQVPSIGIIQTSLASFFGRVNYDYKNKYLLKGTLRADGSSKFAKNNKWGYFPSLAGAWKVSEEDFIKNIPGFPNTKIRASWGVAGKQGISPYQSLSLIASNIGTADGISRALIAYPIRVENPDLKWERNTETNLGVDLSFAKGRYNFTADIYRKNTDGLLINLPTPGYTGYSSNTRNFGELQNQGLELQFNGTIIQRPVRWRSNFNLTFNESKVLEVGEQNYMYIPNGILEEGEPIGVWFGYQQDGVWQSQAQIDEAVANGFSNELGRPAVDIEPGYIRYVDQLTIDTDGDGIPDSTDGVINADDRVKLGEANPKFTGGFYNTFSYKGFSLNVGLQFSYGAKIYNENRIRMQRGRGFANQSARTANRWFPDLYSYDPANPGNMELVRPGSANNEIGRVAGNSGFEFLDRYLEDGSFIRLSDISLAYNVSRPMVNRMGLYSLSVFVTGRNLKLWSDYSGYDPEVNTGPFRSLLPGLDNGAYPREKMIAFGLNIGI